MAEERRPAVPAVLVHGEQTPSAAVTVRIAASSPGATREANSVGAMSDPAADEEHASDTADEADVRQANRRFYDAFEARDIDAMSDVWEHVDRVSCTHPGWRTLRGWGAVSGSWFALFGGPQRLQFILTNEHVAVDGDAAWVTVDENLLGADGSGTVAAVNVFVRADAAGSWSPTTDRRWHRRVGGGLTYPAGIVQEAPPTDGRTLRSLRTREAIVDATIGLLEDGDLRPTAPRVAERASVSVRSVFQHFDDLETLHAVGGGAPRRPGGGPGAPGAAGPPRRRAAGPLRAPAGAAPRGGHADPPSRRRARSLLAGDHRSPPRRAGLPPRGAGAHLRARAPSGRRGT